MNEPLAPAKKPSATSQAGMMLTSEQHAKLAAAYANPPPDLSPEEAQVWQRLAKGHAALSRWASMTERKP
jgi:hypothetical protein